MSVHTLVKDEKLTMYEVVDLIENIAPHVVRLTFDACEVWNWDGESIPAENRAVVVFTRCLIHGPLG